MDNEAIVIIQDAPEGFTWNNISSFIDYINTNLFGLLYNFLLPMAGGILILMIIWGGFKYVQGDTETGKKTLTAAVIGLAIIALALVIINTVINIVST